MGISLNDALLINRQFWLSPLPVWVYVHVTSMCSGDVKQAVHTSHVHMCKEVCLRLPEKKWRTHVPGPVYRG